MRRAELGGSLVSASSITLFLVLGGCWLVDRAHRWETPRLDVSRFVVLRDSSIAEAAVGSEMVPVNLHCPHCLVSLRALQRRRRERAATTALVVLVVDSDRRPVAAAVTRLGAERVWWDRRRVWRDRWGHRLYGEVMRFDARGRYVDTRPPLPSDVSAALSIPLP
jgi:hypothetical protein